MEPTLLMEATRGVLTGVMKGEKPPPASHATGSPAVSLSQIAE